ncbi:EexN family lipoprotein [Legionella waltersii]|uniref:Secreted endonuclease n=1 Tax=Legionella waltersii TaxID=66969 RepID=A0A0W1AM21_9GAMM|nr:EexN family lipoprotein [Legionella waltersii]KTD82397.1 secreted endonuclease [Legionella waltersii]SNV03539.1 secreted endonuclease [Legionella waltersii]
MNKYFVVILIALGLVACQVKKGEQYYLAHPKELQQVLKACPNQQPSGLSCKELEQIGSRLSTLAYQLQSSPQGFGNVILALQQKIAAQQFELQKSGANSALETSIEQNQKVLQYYLAVVKWLESPES